MTKADLRSSHDAMARFIKHLCRFSDTYYNGHRSSTVDKHYRRARRLLKKAGIKYQPPKN